MAREHGPPNRRALRDKTHERILADIRADLRFADRFAETDSDRPWANAAAELHRVHDWIHELNANQAWTGPTTGPTTGPDGEAGIDEPVGRRDHTAEGPAGDGS